MHATMLTCKVRSSHFYNVDMIAMEITTYILLASESFSTEIIYACQPKPGHIYLDGEVIGSNRELTTIHLLSGHCISLPSNYNYIYRYMLLLPLV